MYTCIYVYVHYLVLYGMVIFNGPCIECKAAGLKYTIIIKRIQVHPSQTGILQDIKRGEKFKKN